MGSYLLVMVLTYGGRPVVVQQDNFSSLKTCENARTMIVTHLGSGMVVKSQGCYWK
jgi:hypothetical protein